MTNRSMHWFRQDLRLSDNPALLEASKFDEVFPIYILDTFNNNKNIMGEASSWWLFESLKALNAQLNNKLSIFVGNPEDIIKSFILKNKINSVFWNRCYEPWQIERDIFLKKKLSEKKINVKTFNSSLLWEPWTIKKNDGKPYKVFTPFYKKGCLNAVSPRTPLDKPKNTNYIKDEKNTLRLDDLGLVSDKKWYNKLCDSWSPGELVAKEKLKKFISSNLFNYKIGRDFPSKEGTSLLSPHIHFGEISVNEIWHSIPVEENSNFDHYRSELGWREFSYSQLYYNNQLSTKNLQSKFDSFQWENNEELKNAWKKGETGIPMVDAGMRQLWETGYMHNRLRMIVGSFLVKNLLVDWRFGANWFWNTLVDADLASNSAGWQWVAGCGTDAAPYFRVFNPITQGIKFDQTGDYIRKYIPELKNLPNKFLFSPWEAPKEILSSSKVTLGSNYPFPIVDIKNSRLRALESFKNLKN